VENQSTMQTSFRRLFQVLPLAVTLLASASVSFAQNGPANRIAKTITNDSVSAIKGSVHPMISPENDQGLMDASTVLHGLTMNFAPTAAQQAALNALLISQQQPSSPDYHRWLTPQQFADRFGMSQQDISRVSSWIQSQGFTIDGVADSRNSIRFSGSVATVESALRTQIHRYSIDGETHFANSSEISLPAAIAPAISSIRGLNDFKPRPQNIRVPTANVGLSHPEFTSGTSGNHYLTPGDFATIYNVAPLYTANFTGTGQSIAVLGQTAVVMADITAFRAAAGLSVNNPTIVVVPGTTPPNNPGSGDMTEADLDLEWTGGVAKDASIVFINSANIFDSMLYVIQNMIPVGSGSISIPIISNSYGSCETNFAAADIKTLETALQQANVQGQTLVTASGDTGAADCDNSTTAVISSATQGLRVDYPAASAYVTGAGGNEFSEGTATGATQYWNGAPSSTTDLISSAISYIPEMTWNDTPTSVAAGKGFSASGGGASFLFAKPAWQANVPGIPNDNARDVPDVSLNASATHDPYLFCTQIKPTSSATYTSSCTNGFRFTDNSLEAVGGTSAAAPTFAGILALIEQKLASAQGNINPTLYAIAANPTSYAAAFHDISNGTNIVPCGAGTPDCVNGQLGYTAGTGYDQVTGLGSVDANALAAAFALTDTTTTVSVTPSSPAVGGNVTLSATVAPTTGSGTPTGTVSFALDGASPTAATLSGGTATLTVTLGSGGPHTLAASYSGDATFGPSAGSTSFSVAPPSSAASSTTTVTANPASVYLYGSTTLTAKVQPSSNSSVISGNVTFSNGSTTIGTAPITVDTTGAGVANLTVNAIPRLAFALGANTITATYGGDANFASSTGTATVTVTSPGLGMTVSDMTVAATTPGTSGTANIALTSTGGYSGTVNLTATATNLVASYTIVPASVTLTSGGTGTAVITITTVASSAQTTTGAKFRRGGGMSSVIAGSGAALGCVFLLIPGIRRRRWNAFASLLLFGVAIAGIGCGGGSSNNNGGGTGSGGTVAGTYTVTVVASDSANSAITTSTSFTVTVK
jgi:subtilase family serine protease